MIRGHLLSCKHYVIRDGSVTITKEGTYYYLPYFNKMGININNITTVNKLLIAKRLIRPLILEDMEVEISKLPKTLERRWLLSLLNGDIEKFERLDFLLERKNMLSLTVINS